VLAAVFSFFHAQVRNPEFREVVDLSAALRLTAQADSPFLPSFWLANGIVAGAHGAASETGFEFLLLLANALLLVWLAGEAAQRLFHTGWSALASAGHTARRAARTRGDPLAWLLRPVAGPARWLTVKDVRLFLREPAQWSQFLIFFGMLLLYIAGMRTGSASMSATMWQRWITLLNSVASLLVLATLTTRFVFPLVSLEGRRFWILGQAPLSRRLLVAQKFWLSVAFSASITVALTALSGWRLHLPAAPFVYSVFTVVAASFALSGLAVGFGSMYPNLAEETPARIVSGLGGTLTFIVSAAYVVVAAAAETVVLRWYVSPAHAGASRVPPWPIAAVVASTLALTAATTLVPLVLGARNLEKLEV
jgi:ABC-2 type transport system permease protein